MTRRRLSRSWSALEDLWNLQPMVAARYATSSVQSHPRPRHARGNSKLLKIPYFGNFAFIVHAKACWRKLRLLPREISKPLQDIQDAPLSAAYYDPEWQWVRGQCLRLHSPQLPERALGSQGFLNRSQSFSTTSAICAAASRSHRAFLFPRSSRMLAACRLVPKWTFAASDPIACKIMCSSLCLGRV